ncbi:potassium transporter [Burkholderia lata]|uniref:cation:proton antiporter n=1 Tax=Burkholderia lata (strain ATCC 17760 / DSM 23089 / LMG 22485 / NCIMB 9086 / R18194 / 383) TaxID=482957 RepID=UPI0014530322|nr:cation:proton antiporter [Burkholderia lata]VWB76177.1 potassium transporter [Burkholderia lata]
MSQSLAASSVAAPSAALVIQAQSAVGSSAEHLVLQLLYQLIVILLVTRGVVWLSRRFLGQTAVAGEILAGLVLGPSLLGKFFPEVMHAVFVPETSAIFVGIAQVGLILLMFQIGMEFDFKAQLRQGRSAIAVISIVGVAVPFSLGFVTAPWLWETLAEPRPDLRAFRLFFATTISITAIPILGRIFMELGLSHTRTAALTIGSAAIDDIFGWLLLGAVSTMVISRFDPAQFALNAILVLAYIGAVLLVVRPAMRYWLSRVLVAERHLSTGAIAGILLALFVSASITSNLGIFAIIGGFVIGVALHDNRQFVVQWNERVSGFVHVFFIPVFFAYTGLRTDVGSLETLHDWVVCGLVCLLAFVAKFGGTYIASRIMGESRQSAAAIGVSMNTRALMELIALNIGYDLGVLPKQTFTMLVIMAIASTFIATPLIRWLMQDQRRAVDARSSTAPMAEAIAR